MPYLSRLLNSKVSDSADTVIGRLEDVLIRVRPGEYSPLEYVVIKKRHQRKRVIIPYEAIENFSSEEVSLRTLFSKINFLEHEPDGFVRLNRDVMDQQIVDVAGARVVRVNDLRIGDFEGKMCILGIDVSFGGLLRRLGMSWMDFLGVMKVNLIDWRKAQPVEGVLKLDSVSKDLTRLHPADIANIVEDLSAKQGSNLVLSLDKNMAARVFEEIDPEIQKLLISQLSPEHAARISERMSIDELVDLIQSLPEHQSKQLLNFVEQDRMKKVKKLLSYEDDTAGGLMSTDFLAGLPDDTIAATIEKIRKLSDSFRSLNYVYIIDEKGKYKGVISFRKLLISDKREVLKDVMKKNIHLPVLYPTQSIKSVAHLMTKYDLNSAAVVDQENKFLGVVAVDDVMRVLVPNA
ncbi:MAG: CBS domain-containing protein [Candidatus Magasanikbacteria bacterium]|jgi:CBS domain-containing protein/sporulation protein YlmC with PRC-barrel domain